MKIPSKPVSRGDGPIALLRPINRVDVNEQILSRMKAYLDHEDVKIGSKLPSERQLAAMLHVSRPSVREVLRTLAAMGVVTSMQGRGTYLTASFPDEIHDHDRLLRVRGGVQLLQLWEVRLALEPLAAWLAAARSLEEDLRNFEKQIEGMSKTIDSFEAYARYDLHFHSRIAKACGNRILARLLSNFLKVHFTKAREVLFDGADPVTRSQWGTGLAEHQEIFAALSRRDRDSARSAMTQHIERAIGAYDERLVPTLAARRKGRGELSRLLARELPDSAESLSTILR